MSEYWKSTGKKYCDFCKCWTADNKASIEFHERGKNHQANVKRKLGEIKKNSIEKRKKDEASQKMFEDMEKAALAAVQKDITASSGAVGKSDLKNIVSAHASGLTTGNSDTYPWTAMTAPQGFTYYYNCLTGESSWSMPEVFKKKEENERREKRDAVIEPRKTYYDDKKSVLSNDPHRKEKEKTVVEEVSEEVHNVHPLLGGWSTVTRYEIKNDENHENDEDISATHTILAELSNDHPTEQLEAVQSAGEEHASTNRAEGRAGGKRFKEKVMVTNLVTSSEEQTAFKKRKTKVRSTRKRDVDD